MGGGTLICLRMGFPILYGARGTVTGRPEAYPTEFPPLLKMRIAGVDKFAI